MVFSQGPPINRVNLNLSFFFLMQIYQDGPSLSDACELNALESLMDPNEASKNHLNVSAYKSELLNGFSGKGERLTVIAFNRTTNTPCAIAMFKKTSYQPSLMKPLPSLDIQRDISHTTRKTMWELKYCIRSIDNKGKSLGDICIAAGLEALHNLNVKERRQSTMYVWLQVAGGFKNKSALGLYLSYGFEIVAMYLGSILMVLKNVDNVSINRAVSLLIRKTELTYLLPVLKERANLCVSSPAHQTAAVPTEESNISQSSTALKY